MASETTLKHVYISRDLADKKAKERRLNLILLIEHFFKSEGYIDTYLEFKRESKIPPEYEICDNMDLNNVLHDYETYYYMRFQKYPNISKKVPKEDIDDKKVRHKLKNIPKNMCKSIVSKEPQPTAFGLEDSLKVEPMFNKDKTKSLSELTCDIFKPLGSFEGYCDEWKYLADIIVKEIVQKDLKVKWDDVKGLTGAKKILKEAMVYPIKYPALYQGVLSPWKGVLLYGPSGTGKTMLAKAVATECSSTFFNISASSIVSKWRGDSEKLVRVMFELARHEAPSTIFIDELDAIASRRDTSHEHEASRRLKSELLVQLDGLCHSDDKVFFLSSTNLPWDLDPAILRRLEKRILIDLPELDARSQMFQTYLPTVLLNEPKFHSNINYNTVAEFSEGYSGSEIKLACKEAAMSSLRHIVQDLETKSSKGASIKEVPPVTDSSLDEALKKTKPPPRAMIEKYKSWENQYGST